MRNAWPTRCEFNYLDSGALYRLVALRALRKGLVLRCGPVVRGGCSHRSKFCGGRVRLDGQDVTDAIRSEDVSQLASRIAVLSGVRKALLKLQRSQRRPPGLVADGRDMGTVVFPEADPKIYLTASVPARADRRYKQLMEKGFSASIPSLSQEQVRLDIEARDLRDAQRAASPFKPAEDAHCIDSSELLGRRGRGARVESVCAVAEIGRTTEVDIKTGQGTFLCY